MDEQLFNPKSNNPVMDLLLDSRNRSVNFYTVQYFTIYLDFRFHTNYFVRNKIYNTENIFFK